MPMNTGTNFVRSLQETQRLATRTQARFGEAAAAQPTRQWTCDCGAANPDRRDRCRTCGEARKAK